MPQSGSFLVAVLACALVRPSLQIPVGINCTETDCEEDRAPCPPDSVLKTDMEGRSTCVCFPEHCLPPPRCRYRSNLVLKHKATGAPGDCCDIHECVIPPEVNCSGVVCAKEEGLCPEDSYRLPARQSEGDCCSVPQGCACLPAPCPPPSCPRGHSHKVVSPGTTEPGSCCPTYKCYPQGSEKTCTYDNKEVRDGEKWMKNECSECQCNGGMVHCASAVRCPVLPDCTKMTTPTGQCCPVCVIHNDIDTSLVNPDGCKSGSGVIYENGAKWKEDDCTSCTCLGGVKKCQASMCKQTCTNATYIKGECCPRCNNDTTIMSAPGICPPLDDCMLDCNHGYQRDESNCLVCKCKEESSDCLLNCPGGLLKDSEGKELCACAPVKCPTLANCSRKCKHGYRTNSNGCELCKCHNCKPIPDCRKNCPHGLRNDHRGCPMCSCITPYPSGPNNNTSNDKKESYCTSGQELRDDGETWFDGCTQCYCLGGKEMCGLVSCPKLDCPNPVHRENSNSCCPTCPGNETRVGGMHVVCYSGQGVMRKEGERWKMSECIECVCHTGQVLCHGQECPPTPCTHPLPPALGQCCSTCLPHSPHPHELGCGEGREAGKSWREGSCESCVCIKGVATCFTQMCDTYADSTCPTPLQVKNQCCPICPEHGPLEEDVCRVGNITYTVGDTWLDYKSGQTCTCTGVQAVTCSPPYTNSQTGNNILPWIFITVGLAGATVFLVLFVKYNHCGSKKNELMLGKKGAAFHNSNGSYTQVPANDQIRPM